MTSIADYLFRGLVANDSQFYTHTHQFTRLILGEALLAGDSLVVMASLA